MINRSVVVVRGKAPFLAWLKGLPDPEERLTLAELRASSNAYLVPPYENENDRSSILQTVFGHMFEEELMGWWTDASAYPPRRNLALFLEWFDVEFHELVFDLGDDEIEST